MTLDLVKEIWDNLKPNIITSDIKDSAEVLVNCLIDHGYDTSEIHDAFKTDTTVIRALSFFDEKPEDNYAIDSLSLDDYDDDDDEYSGNEHW